MNIFKKITLLFLLVCSSFALKAGPGSGGFFEIISVDTATNDWDIRYTAYNDCNDPIGALTFCFEYWNGNYTPPDQGEVGAAIGAGTNFWTTLPTLTQNVSPQNTVQCYDLPACSGPCVYQILTKTVYEFTVNLPSNLNLAEPFIRGRVCGGAGGRPNTDNSNGGQYSNYIVWRPKLFPKDTNGEYTPANHTAQPDSCPTLLACMNRSNTITFNYSDPDGDSIAFGLVDCKNRLGTSNFNYQGGWTPGNPISGLTNASIDPLTGNITFTPTIAMDGQVCLRVSEYRTIVNWNSGSPFTEVIEIARHYQDFVVNVVDCGINVLNDDTDTAITIATDDTCVAVFYSDSVVPGYTVLATVTMDSVLVANGATFTQLPPDPYNNYGIFCWTPPCNLIGGEYKITVVVQDDNCPINNIDTIVYTIQIEDPQEEAVCLDTTIYLDASGNFTIDTSYIDGGSYDSCGIDSIHLTRYTYSCADVGTDTIQLIVTDLEGGTDTCSAVVTILDTLRPNPICKDTVIYLDSFGTFTIDSSYINNGSNDNCAISTITLSRYVFGCADLDSNLVTMIVTDIHGNIDSCTAYVIVRDTIAPNIICNSGTAYLDSSGQVAMDTTGLINVIYENCTVDSVWLSSNDSILGCVDTGFYSLTIYVADGAGNIDSCTSVITVLDTIAPYIACLSPTLYLNASGQIMVDTSSVIDSVGDNCGVDSVWIRSSDSTLNCSDTGYYLIRVYVMDGSGNMDSCTSTATVVDTIPPSITCNAATLYLDATGSLVIDTTGLISSVSDNCSVDSVWINVNDTSFGCVDTGLYNVRIYVMDGSGNMDSCISALTILDTIAPTIVCQPATLYLDSLGQLTVDTTGLIVSTGDNCSVDSVWVNVNDTSFGCVDTGLYNVRIYVMDPSGNIDSCVSQVNILDTIAPQPLCQDTTIYLDITGNYTIDSSYIDNGSFDSCGVLNITLSRYTFSCTDTGQNSVTLYVQDVNGNIDSCSAIVTVLDTIVPTITCQPATYYLNALGQLTIDTSGLVTSTADNCGVDSVWINVNDTSFGCVDTGLYNVRIYVMDPSGNMDSCISQITILDTIAPQPLCQDTTIYLDITGNYTIDSSYIDNGSFDSCGVLNITLSRYTFSCADTGQNSVTLYVQDVNGNIDSCSAIVTVLDTIVPTITCQPATFYLNALGQLVIDTTGLITSTADNCGVDSVWLNTNDTSFGCVDTGNYVVTIYIMDPSGNMDSCQSTITILDTIAPQPLCQDTTIYLDATGNYTIDSSYIDNGSFDSCGVLNITLSRYTFSCADTGQNSVTLYVRDVNGNIDSCSAIVTVLDTIVPTITCQPATFYLNALGQLVIDTTGLITSTADNCGVDSVWLNTNDTAFGCVDTGNYVVTIYIMDPSGNMDSCQSTITILDTIAPQPLCQDTTIYLDITGNYTIDSSYIDNGSFDSCGVLNITLSRYTFSCADTGQNSVTLYVQDVNGNIDSCSAIVTVLDTIVPTITCQPATFYLNALGQLVIDTTGLITSTADNCGVDSVWLNTNDTAFGCVDTGNYVVTIYIMDPSGNMDSCQSTITILDTIAPQPLCQDTTIYLDITGNYTIDSSYIDNGSFDSCGVLNITLSRYTFSCADTGQNSVTLYVRDVNGNIDSCSAIVTVLDTIVPTITCQPATFYLNALGQLVIDTTGLITSTADNCGVDSVWLNTNDTAFGCVDTGNYVVTIYIMDPSGNMDSCQSTITILDTIAPQPLCQDTTIYLDITGNYTIDSSYIDNGSFDSCGVLNITLSRYTFSCADTGQNSVTLYVRDVNGNIDSCSAFVTVLDTIPPQAVCMDTTIYLDATGSYTIDSSYIDGGSADPCGVFVLSQSIFNCSDIGVNTVRLWVYDANNNVDSCDALVTVLDTLNPTAICKDTLLYLDSMGIVVIDSSYINNGSFDNCAIATITVSRDTFNCIDTGVNQVMMVVTDVSGNTDTCYANVTIRDTIYPLAYAGLDDSICGIYNYNLNANTPPGTFYGTWNVLSGPNAPLFSNINDPNANISGLIEGVYTIEWSVTNGPNCNVSYDTVDIYVYDPPIANAGPDTGLCNQFSLGMSANTPAGSATGVWTYVPGSPTVPVFSIPNNPNSVVSNLDEGTYYLVWTVSNGNCPPVSDTVRVDVYELPTANAGPDQSQCGRQNALLLANTPAGTATGLWTLDPTAPNPNNPTITSPNNPTTFITGLIEGTYTFVWTVSNGVCPPATDTILLNVYDSVDANAGPDTNLCGVYSLQLYGNQPIGTATGRWIVNPLTVPPSTPIFVDSSVYNTTVSNLVEGTYRLLWVHQNGVCPNSVDSMTIRVWDNPPAYAGEDSSLCAIYTINMWATPISGTSQGVWTLDPTASNPNIPTIVSPTQYNTSITGLIEGTYTFVWHVTNGPCFDYYDTVRVSIFDQPTAIVGPDQNLCDVPSTIISAVPLTGSATGTWYLANGIPNNPTFNPNTPTTTVTGLQEAGTYTLFYEAVNGVCPVSRDTIVINNYPIPVVDFTQDTTAICQEECVQFTNLSTIHPSDNITNYYWLVDGQVSNAIDPEFCFPYSGSVDVRLIAESSNGCRDTVTRNNLITVHTIPIAGFESFLIDDENVSTKIQVQDQSYYGNEWWYSFGDGDTSILQNPQHTYYDSGFYDITQIVRNTFGCADTLTKTIYVHILTVYVPNTFTPDGDGKNEGFVPVVGGDDPDAYLFRVFNRWGELIFQSQLKGDAWDGTHEGQECKTDTYVWTLRTKYKDGDRRFEYRGHVNLLR